MTWDGKGVDPWLPQRLDARLEVARVERDVRRAVWAALSEWLVATARRVLRQDAPPDLDAIWARAPLWREAVELILNGEIFKAVALAFERVVGKGTGWSQRPAMVRYFAEVRNRLVRIPDEVYDLVARELVKGINLGESIPELSKRIDTVLSTTESERWPNRATVIARTESIGALNQGRLEAFGIVSDDEDEPLLKMWLAVDDTRTRPSHRAAEGQRVPLDQPFSVGLAQLMFPGDPTGPANEVISCRCTMLLVGADEHVDLSNRQMRG